MSAKQYVDLTGISTYDELIKDYIGDNTPNMISLTAAQYAALTPAEKQDPNKYYIITDSTVVTSNNIGDLSDVTITSPQNNQALKYDATNQIWVNGDAASAISQLTDVQLTSLANDNILKYNSTLQKWVNSVAESGANITVTTTDPGEGSYLATGDLLIVVSDDE